MGNDKMTIGMNSYSSLQDTNVFSTRILTGVLVALVDKGEAAERQWCKPVESTADCRLRQTLAEGQASPRNRDAHDPVAAGDNGSQHLHRQFGQATGETRNAETRR